MTNPNKPGLGRRGIRNAALARARVILPVENTGKQARVAAGAAIKLRQDFGPGWAKLLCTELRKSWFAKRNKGRGIGEFAP